MPQPNTILAFDDDPIVHAILDELSALAGLRMIAAHDGRTGLTAYDAAPDEITLVIVDLYMPDMDGIELLRALGARRAPQPVLIVSGANRAVREGAELIARASGVDLRGVLHKPVSVPALQRAITDCLAGRGTPSTEPGGR